MAVQGWKGGLGHVSNCRSIVKFSALTAIALDQHSPYPLVRSHLTRESWCSMLIKDYSVPSDPADLDLHSIERD